MGSRSNILAFSAFLTQRKLHASRAGAACISGFTRAAQSPGTIVVHKKNCSHHTTKTRHGLVHERRLSPGANSTHKKTAHQAPFFYT